MFKKLFRFSITAVGLVTKLIPFIPQVLWISVVSEIATIALEKLDKYTKSKKDSDSEKALEKLGNKIIFIAEALKNHSESDFDDKLFEAVKKKTYYNNENK